MRLGRGRPDPLGRPKGGKPRNKMLLAEVEALLVARVPTQTIARDMAAKYDLAERTIFTYVNFVRDSWAAEDDDWRPYRKAQMRRSLEREYRTAVSRRDGKGARDVLRQLRALDGLDAPVKLQVEEGDHAESAAFEQALKLPPHARRKRIDELARAAVERVRAAAARALGEDPT